MFRSRLLPFSPLSPPAAIWLALLALAACSGGGGGSAPVAAPDAYVFPSVSQLAVAAPGVLSNDTGTSPTAVLVGQPSNAAAFTFNADGSFTYKSVNGTSNDAFSYKITDGSGSSNVTTVSLAPNQPPAAVNACLPTTAGVSLNGTLTATDEPASQPDIYGPVPSDPSPVGPYKGKVQINVNGTFTYTPTNSNYVGMDKFKFQVTDKFGLTSTGIATVLINGAVRIMPLGDSITEGVWYPSTTNSCNDLIYSNCPAPGVRVSYRQKLYNDLEALSPNYAVNMVGSNSNGVDALLSQPNHEGHPGYSALQLANGYNNDGVNGVSTWLTSNPPDIILLHAGTNSFSTSATDVNTLLNNISTWAQGYYGALPAGEYPVTVFVARIIKSADGTLGGSPTAVTTFNDNVELIATDRTDVKVYMVNQETGANLIYSIDPTCLNEGPCNGNTGDMGNNLHPNPSGYTKMADKWKADLQASGVLPTCP